MGRTARVMSETFPLRQRIGKMTLNSPLIPANQVATTLAHLIKAGVRVFTLDFALGRFRTALREAGLSEQKIASLMRDNLDHHDGNNPGLTATEVAIRSISQFKGKYAVVSDQTIDADNVCSTFVAMNPKMARAHKAILTEVARYGDYFDEVSESAMQIALTIDAMRFGKNKFNKPFFLLTPEQQGELFNEILAKMPKMLTDIGLFREMYEGELAKLNAARERGRAEALIRPVNEFTAVVDEPAFPRAIAYQLSDKAIVIGRKDLGVGKFNYNPVGLNPRVANYDLTGLWERLRNLENKERAKKGLPALEVNQSWGGREAAGGSPKDEGIGSILTLDQVANEIRQYLLEQKA